MADKPKPHELFTITLYSPKGIVDRWENARDFSMQGHLFCFLNEDGIEVAFPSNLCYTMIQQAKTPESTIIQTVGDVRPTLSLVGAK